MMTRGTATRIVFFGISDCGLQRQNNEDHFIVADLTRKLVGVEDNRIQPDLLNHEVGMQGTLLAVADGLGGHEGGEIASLLAVDTIVQALFTGPEDLSFSEQLTQAVDHAHEVINKYHSGGGNQRHMASTLTAIHIGDAQMTIVQVGDSRAYRFGNGPLTMLTEDQTVVHMMLKKGLLTEEEAQQHPHRNVILQALGQDKAVVPAIQTLPLQDGDCLLLCSDGLTSYVPHERIEAILREEQDEYTRCRRLVEAANAAGGSDNVTVLLARVSISEVRSMADQPEPLVGAAKKRKGIKFPWSSRTADTEDALVGTETTKHHWMMPLRVPWFLKGLKNQESAEESGLEGAAEPLAEMAADSTTSVSIKSLLGRWGHKGGQETQPEVEQPLSFSPAVAEESARSVADPVLPPHHAKPSWRGSREKKGVLDGPVWNPTVLKVLEDQLAHYIGPVAKILVGRAAAQTEDVYELCHALATQLPSVQEQKHFLEAVSELVAHHKR